MTTKLPGHPATMEYDELAHKNLRKFFRTGKFVFSQQTTLFSNREFGIDWIIEILRRQQNTGIQFLVQSKTTEVEETDGFISVPIETKNINYLANKENTVFVHVFQRKKRVGYWLWFNQWYSQNYSPAWKSEQGSVTLRIPAEQKLSTEAVKQIVQIVSEQNLRTRIYREINLFNDRSTGFHLSPPEFIDNNIISVAHAKGSDAGFSFTVDEIGQAAIRKHEEQGYAVQFPLVETDFPSPLEGVLDLDGTQYLTMLPLVPAIGVQLSVTLQNSNGEIIHDFGVVDFRCVRFGTKESEFWAQPQNDGYFVLSMTCRPPEVEGEKNAYIIRNFCSNPYDAYAAKPYIEMYEKYRFSTVVMTDAASGKIVFNFQPQNLPQFDDNTRRFVNAAYNLREQHAIEIPVLPGLNEESVFFAELASDILTNDKSKWKMVTPAETWHTPASQARMLVQQYKEELSIYVAEQKASRIGLEINGIAIDLGMLRTVYHVTKINNIEEIEGQLANATLMETDGIRLDLEIDWETSFTIVEKSDATTAISEPSTASPA